MDGETSLDRFQAQRKWEMQGHIFPENLPMKRFTPFVAVALVWASLAPAQESKPVAPATGKVASFETDADNPFVLRNNISGTRVAEHATDGKFALRVVAKGSDKPTWPALWLYPATEPNWSARELLVMDIFLETPESVELGAQLCLEGRKSATTVSLGRLKAGWNQGLALCLQDFDADLSHVANLALYVARPRKDVVFTIDNVRWEVLPQQSVSNGWLNVKDFGASGSEFETTATTTAGSDQVTVAEVGDLRAGQRVSVSRCNIRYLRPTLYGPGEPYATSRPLDDALEIRGYDGSSGSWLAYLLEVDGADPVTFRWKGDLAKPWAAAKVPVTYDWQQLSGGTEIRFKRRQWKPGELVTFSARDQLVSTIEKIEGKVLTLEDIANRTAAGAVVHHTDQTAIQKAIELAIRRKCNLFFPAGHYRIPGGLHLANAAGLRLEGASAESTVLDISDGEGSCFGLSGGTEVTICNFTMVGHTGLAQAPRSFTTSGTERVLIENVHASRMASECFYAQGPARAGKEEPKQYQKSLTYLRCSVTDCAANAFNNNDRGENTSILYCRVDGAGWHAAEMPARFLRVVGCYFRNTGAVTIGDMSHRYEDLHELGCGQAMVRDNVFEGIGRCGGVAVNHGSSQVVISGNLFINFNGPAITVSSHTVRPSLPWFTPDAPLNWGSFPSHNAVVSGNIIDMTYAGTNPANRVGIQVDASEVTIADNQVYVRGRCDPRVTGIKLGEPALCLNVHDNLIHNCGAGLVTGRAGSRVTQVIDSATFLEASLPLEWRYTHQYQGWNIAWIHNKQVAGTSAIESFDPGTLRFKLKAPRDLKVGDAFEVFPSGSANWSIHDNTITGCRQPLVLDCYGSETSLVRDNLLTRGEATGVKAAVEVCGLFKLIGNQITGFDEHDATAFSIVADPFGRSARNVYRDNVVRRCAGIVPPLQKALWDATRPEGNLFHE